MRLYPPRAAATKSDVWIRRLERLDVLEVLEVLDGLEVLEGLDCLTSFEDHCAASGDVHLEPAFAVLGI